MQTPDLKVSCQIKGLALQEAQYEQPDILNWPACFYEKIIVNQQERMMPASSHRTTGQELQGQVTAAWIAAVNSSSIGSMLLGWKGVLDTLMLHRSKRCNIFLAASTSRQQVAVACFDMDKLLSSAAWLMAGAAHPEHTIAHPESPKPSSACRV